MSPRNAYQFALSVIYILLKDPLSFLSKVNRVNLATLQHALKYESFDKISKNLDLHVHGEHTEKPSYSKTKIRRFVKSIPSQNKSHKNQLLVICHEASRTGAPLIIFSLMKVFEKEMGIQSTVILLKGGGHRGKI